jgi:CRISPR/Cas system-associated endoribonuclease Cas2
MIHLDNANHNNSRRSQECLYAHRGARLQHSAYSSDLAPSDFFFGFLKEKLTHFDCWMQEDLRSAITSIFNEIDKKSLIMVVVSWMERSKWAIRKNR